MIKFENVENHHPCTSHNEGEWVVWRCPICVGYERRFNLKTSEMHVKGKTEFNHTGFNAGKPEINKPLIELINEN